MVGIKFFFFNFPYEWGVLDISSFTSSMIWRKLAHTKKILAYSKNDGHEEKGIYC